MASHPAFWPLSEDADGTVRGVWNGEEVVVGPGSPAPDDAAFGNGPVVSDRQPRVVPRLEVERSLGIASANFGWLLCRELDSLRPDGVKALVELALIMQGLPRHAALAASDAPERPLAEALTKLSIHWTRVSEPWRELVQRLSGVDSGHLHPLPTTLALQLELEELASRDLVAYVACASKFGFPGDGQTVEFWAKAAGDLAVSESWVRPHLDEWSKKAASLEDNYASVKSLRPMGSLKGVDLLGLALDTEVPFGVDRKRRCLSAIHDVADTVTLFSFGISHFFRSGQEPWPRRRLAWAGA